MTAATAIVDGVLGYAPGCTFENDWCDAPERKYGNSSIGCAVGGSGESTSLSLIVGAVFAGLMLLGRRRAGRRGRAGAIAVALAAACCASPAFGESTPDEKPAAPTAATEKQSAAPASADTSRSRWVAL